MDVRNTNPRAAAPEFVSMTEADRLAGLRQQHQSHDLSRYDGHNRRPIASSTKHLAHRRSRRRTRARLRATRSVVLGQAVEATIAA